MIECEGTIYLQLAVRCLKAGLIKTVSILIVLHHETHQTHNCVLSSPMSHPRFLFFHVYITQGLKIKSRKEIYLNRINAVYLTIFGEKS